MKRIGLIVAAGSGLRMGSEIPKQFMMLNGKPLLMLTLEVFQPLCNELILVIQPEQELIWKKLCEEFEFFIPIRIVAGGKTRFQSVYNALKTLESDCLVAIHDGVRPLISPKIIENSFETAEKNGAAITVVKLKDTIRGPHGTMQRDNFRLVQTPQTFHTDDIQDAYKFGATLDAAGNIFTDDASVYERTGRKCTLIEGSYRNIKITTPEDIIIAQALLNHE